MLFASRGRSVFHRDFVGRTQRHVNACAGVLDPEEVESTVAEPNSSFMEKYRQ
jgi:hypothetical protein